MSNIKIQLIEGGYIPLDKSWMIRMGILDLLNGRKEIFEFLKRQEDELSEDLEALLRALKSWRAGEQNIDVGESATLYRFLRFASWKLNENKQFILRGSLRDRKICDNEAIICYSLEDLLGLDSGTSQWASAAVLLGNQEVVADPPFKLALTYEAVEHWKKQRKDGQCWEFRYDETILSQAVSFLELLERRKTSFSPQQAEDYCFARIFGLITKEHGESLWSSLRGHERNRIEEMELVRAVVDSGKEIESKDHRSIQAGAMRQKLLGKIVRVKYPGCIKKSWPQFNKFLNDSIYLHGGGD